MFLGNDFRPGEAVLESPAVCEPGTLSYGEIVKITIVVSDLTLAE